VHEKATLLLVTLPNIHRLIFFTDWLSNKPFLYWLLRTPPHLKYVATLPSNLSLMACFVDINISQGSVATYAKCGGIFNIHRTANLLRNLAIFFLNRLRFGRIMVMSLRPRFSAHPVYSPNLATCDYCLLGYQIWRNTSVDWDFPPTMSSSTWQKSYWRNGQNFSILQASKNSEVANNCTDDKGGEYHHHHHHHLFAQYTEMNSKMCNVPDRKANSFSSNNCP